MTPADERIVQLLKKWQTSLELHARYVGLDEEQYWLVQPWPRHQRPTQWVVQLARQRVEDLSRLVQTRIAAGDPSLSEALELMSFLTNLVGSQHVERFIPVAEPEHERPLTSLTVTAAPGTDPSLTGTREMPTPRAADTSASGTREMPAPRTADTTASGTREMPAPPPASSARAKAASAPKRARARAPETGTPAAAGRSSTAATSRTASPAPAMSAREVVADAARLLKWGRDWHELPEAISRLAGRPSAAQVRDILKQHRAAIEQHTRGNA